MLKWFEDRVVGALFGREMQDLARPRTDALSLIKTHGTAKAALRHLIESGEINGSLMQTVQMLQTLAYAEDNGWHTEKAVG